MLVRTNKENQKENVYGNNNEFSKLFQIWDIFIYSINILPSYTRSLNQLYKVNCLN